jgi:hypothetical protein
VPGFEDVDFSDLTLRAPSPPEAMEAFRASVVGGRLPAGFLDFYAACDGGEGYVGDAWLNLWSVADMPERNRAYRVQEFAPGLVIIGSSTSHYAYAFDTRGQSLRYVSVPWVEMNLRFMEEIAETFRGFLIELQRGWTPSLLL